MKRRLFTFSLIFLLVACAVSLGRVTAPLPLPITGAVHSLGKEGSGCVQFESKEVLKEWLAQDDTDEYIYAVADKSGEVVAGSKCEKYAMKLQERALTDGYKMSFYFVTKSAMWELFRVRISRNEAHAMNLTVIGNDIFAIEPQTDKVTHIGYLD